MEHEKSPVPWTFKGGLPVVRGCMDKRVPTVRPDTPILDAVRFLLRHHVTGAPVIDKSGQLVGILTEKDCLSLLTTGVESGAPKGVVSEFMTTEVTTISPDTDLYFVAGLFRNSTFRRLPVVENGRLVGAITRLDLLRAIQAYLD